MKYVRPCFFNMRLLHTNSKGNNSNNIDFYNQNTGNAINNEKLYDSEK